MAVYVHGAVRPQLGQQQLVGNVAEPQRSSLRLHPSQARLDRRVEVRAAHDNRARRILAEQIEGIERQLYVVLRSQTRDHE